MDSSKCSRVSEAVGKGDGGTDPSDDVCGSMGGTGSTDGYNYSVDRCVSETSYILSTVGR